MPECRLWGWDPVMWGETQLRLQFRRGKSREQSPRGETQRCVQQRQADSERGPQRQDQARVPSGWPPRWPPRCPPALCWPE